MVSDDKRYQLLTDIQGVEDFSGDMDFKVAGTRKGITAIQMDVKGDGLNAARLGEAFEQSRQARNRILDVMQETIAEPRPTSRRMRRASIRSRSPRTISAT